ncbi:MAG: AraC family transcriptional regulator [Armatimonadota bacterium]|nr:AraC family transcriptional regulator [Armatimonadota bacterium]
MINNLHLRLFEADCIAIDSGWNTRHVQSSFWRFYRNGSDGASLELDDGIYPLEAGRLYFVPAGVHFHCRNTACLQHFYIHFDVIGLPRLAMRELFHGPVCLPPSSPLEETMTRLGPQMVRRSETPMATQCRLQALLYEAFALSLDSVPPEQMERSLRRAAALEPVLPAIRWIEANLSQPLSNAYLAGLCFFSEDYFIRRFRECVGQSPVQYIQERRVTQAAQELLFTTHSIEQIAEETGFGSRFYFTRVFARQTGVTPAAYRKASRV